jgi:hypothetical protein
MGTGSSRGPAHRAAAGSAADRGPGLCGGTLPDVLWLIANRHGPAVPASVRSLLFWIGLACLVALGGGVAIVLDAAGATLRREGKGNDGRARRRSSVTGKGGSTVDLVDALARHEAALARQAKQVDAVYGRLVARESGETLRRVTERLARVRTLPLWKADQELDGIAVDAGWTNEEVMAFWSHPATGAALTRLDRG